MRRILDWLTNDLLLKVTALGLAFLLWTLVKTDNQVPIGEIPIQVLNRDPGWVLVRPPEPALVQVTFSGPVRELIRVAAERPTIIVPIDDVSDTLEVVLLHTNYVVLNSALSNTRVDDIRPAAVRLTFDRVMTRTIPLAARLIGAPAPGMALAGPPIIDPPTVWASGPSSRIEKIDSLRLPPVDLSRRTGTDTVPLAIDTTGLGIAITPREVRLIVPIRPIVPDTATTDSIASSSET